MIGEVVQYPSPGRVPMPRILESVRDYYGIPMKQLVGKRRFASIIEPRHIAYYLARELTPMSLAEIGRWFGVRDHTTVLHGVKSIKRLIEANADIGMRAVYLLCELKGGLPARPNGTPALVA